MVNAASGQSLAQSNSVGRNWDSRQMFHPAVCEHGYLAMQALVLGAANLL